MERGLGMHHTMADGTWDRFLNAYAQVTAAQARLTPDNAVTEVDRLILTAWRDKLPVYMELPSDIGYLDIEVPAAPLVLEEPPSDPERLQSCTAAIADRLSLARSPAILVDLDADRFGVAGQIMELAEKTRVPVAVAPTAKAVIDETFPAPSKQGAGHPRPDTPGWGAVWPDLPPQSARGGDYLAWACSARVRLPDRAARVWSYAG